MKRLGILAVLALALAAAAPAGAGDGAHAALDGYKYCGKTSIGHTNAKVYGRRVGCADSRRLVRLWNRKVRKRTNCTEANDFCRINIVHRFRCAHGGSDYLVRLRCIRGKQRVRGYWGG